MGAPTIRSVGTFTKAPQTTTLTPPLPAGYQANDTLVIIVSTEGTNSGNTIATPSGWQQAAGSPCAAPNIQVAAFYKTSTASETAPTFSALAANSQCGAMICVQGAETDGSPINVTATSTSSPNSAITCPAVTTTTIDTLIMNAVADNINSAAPRATGWTNSSLSGVTEIVDDGYNFGNANGFAVAVGTLAAPGSSGSTTATYGAAVPTQARITIAFEQPSTEHTQTPSDGVTGTDASTQDFSKVVADSGSPLDVFEPHTDKNVADAAPAADTLAVAIDKPLTESAGSADTIRVATDKAIDDAVTLDDVTISFVDPGDTVTATDDQVIEAGPTLTDSVFTEDSINIGGIFIAADVVTANDDTLLELGPEIIDTVVVSDVPAVVPHDAPTATDVVLLTFGRDFNDNVGAGSNISFEVEITTVRVHPRKASDLIARVVS